MKELGTKAERVGNFRLFRTYAPCGAKQRVDAVKVTNLDGSWGVVIPMTMNMYSVIVELFREDTDKSRDILMVIFTNFMSVTSIPHGGFQKMVCDSVVEYAKSIGPGEEDSEEDLERMQMKEEAQAILDEEENK